VFRVELLPWKEIKILTHLNSIVIHSSPTFHAQMHTNATTKNWCRTKPGHSSCSLTTVKLYCNIYLFRKTGIVCLTSLLACLLGSKKNLNHKIYSNTQFCYDYH
jgi:hypothetical protein